MADVTVYVDTDNAAGGRDGTTRGTAYNSLNEAWEAEDANIDPGDNYTFLLWGTTADTSRVLMDSWPQTGAGDATILIQTDDTETDGFYDGDDNYSTAHYRMEFAGGANQAAIHVHGDDETSDIRTVTIDGLQIKRTSSATVGTGIQLEDGVSGTVNILGCRIWMDATGTFQRAVRTNSNITTAHTLVCQNNIVFSDRANGVSAFNINRNNCTFVCHNNAMYYGASTGEDAVDDVTGVTSDIQNNVCFAVTAGTNIEFDLVGTVTNKDYNAQTDSGSRGTNGWAIASTDFTSAGAGAGNQLTPVASPATNWDESDLTNADNSNVPIIDIRRKIRNTAAGTTTAAGCFAKAGEGATGLAIISESDAALAPSILKRVIVGAVATTDTPLPITIRKRVQAGPSAEADAVLPLQVQKSVQVAALTEADAALTPAVLKRIAAGLQTETDSIFSLQIRKRVLLGVVSETDAALSVTIGSPDVLALLAETDTVLPLTVRKRVILGLASEADAALPVTIGAPGTLAIISETDVPLAPSIRKNVALPIVAATDTPLPLTVRKRVNLGISAETDAVPGLSVRKTVTLGIVSETDSVLVLGGLLLPGGLLCAGITLEPAVAGSVTLEPAVAGDVDLREC